MANFSWRILVEYIKQGKITITDSYNFQDLGKRIKEVPLCENDVFLTAKIVEQLIHGAFPVYFLPLLEATKCSKMDEKDEDSIPLSRGTIYRMMNI